MRLFAAIAIPDSFTSMLEWIQNGIPGARWTPREKMHLTLRFIDEADGRVAADVDDALATVNAPSFPLTLRGVGHFGGRMPTSIWAGVEQNESLIHLARKIESALQRVGLPAETRRFSPHITLARLRSISKARVLDYLTDHARFVALPFHVESYSLYSSWPSPGAHTYRRERSYQLERSPSTSPEDQHTQS